jgi:hypothetical protein
MLGLTPATDIYKLNAINGQWAGNWVERFKWGILIHFISVIVGFGLMG